MTTAGGAGYATANATGGTGDVHAGIATANASVQGAASGYAHAASSASMTGGSVSAGATAPVGGPASAMTISTIGSGTQTLIPVAAGEAMSNAALTPGASTIGVGGMSIGYGGGGQSLQYETTAYFNFTASSPATLYLTLLENASSGAGFDSLTFDINSSVGSYVYTFTTLASAETFFTSNMLDLGDAVDAGGQYVYLHEFLTASAPTSGFSFDYALGSTPYSPPPTVPEPSTWAMMLMGFGGLGFAGWRRGQRKKARFAA